jgi:hypothetical protein
MNEEKIEFHSLLEFQAETNLPESFVNRQNFRHFIKFCNAEAAKTLPTYPPTSGRPNLEQVRRQGGFK